MRGLFRMVLLTVSPNIFFNCSGKHFIPSFEGQDDFGSRQFWHGILDELVGLP